MLFLIVLLLIAAVIVYTVFLVKLRLCIYVSLDKRSVIVKAGMIKIPLYPCSPKEKKAKAEKQSEDNIKQGIGSFGSFWTDNSGHFKKALLRLKKRILFEKFNFEYRCGFADAANTAVMYGVVNGLYYNIFAFLDRNFKVKEMHGDISAAFNENNKHIALDAVLRLALSDIIYIAAALIPVIKNIKINKGGALNV